ncbi:MAG TPA: site-2 protease family protein [Candidatus Angelobacter sp.]|nr:site-2 protease family protein [Candidatus Angelobacter sp.]
MPTRRGAIRIFRLFGIDVFLHWSWIIIAFIRIDYLHYGNYHSSIWYVAECLALFGIVLIHEFGHALACRSVGGVANFIILWPLGGVAYVSPPQRPGAMLWSIAAGPLVNVALLPVFSVFWYCGYAFGWPAIHPDLYQFLQVLWFINLVLLIFNMLPVYPLDGGQILRSVLWFFLGRAKSLMVASIIGFVGVGLGAIWAIYSFVFGDAASATVLGVFVIFIGLTCWGGFQQARALARLEGAPRRQEFRCPSCHESPPIGQFWGCNRCRRTFDTFQTQGFCPHCQTEYSVTACPFCYSRRPMPEWRAFSPAPPQA